MGLFKKAAPTIKNAENKEKTKIIYVAGAENGLIPFQLAHHLRSIKKCEVLLIDNSLTQDLFNALPKVGEVANAYEISAVSCREYTAEVFDKFDYVIVYGGHCPDTSYIELSDMIILIHDYTLYTRDFLRNFDSKNKPVRMFFINKVTAAITEKMLIEDMEKTIIPPGVDVISLEFSEEDASSYIHFLYDGFRPLSKMSKEYQKALDMLVKDVTDPKNILDEREDEE